MLFLCVYNHDKKSVIWIQNTHKVLLPTFSIIVIDFALNPNLFDSSQNTQSIKLMRNARIIKHSI